MGNNTIFNLFTKSVLQGLLDKVGGDYKASQKKDKLIDLLCDFDLKTVLNKMSTKQLKVVLSEMKLAETGKKSVLIHRIIGDERETTKSFDIGSESQIEQEMKDLIECYGDLELGIVFDAIAREKQLTKEKSRGWKAELIEAYIGEGGELDIQNSNDSDISKILSWEVLGKEFCWGDFYTHSWRVFVRKGTVCYNILFENMHRSNKTYVTYSKVVLGNARVYAIIKDGSTYATSIKI